MIQAYSSPHFHLSARVTWNLFVIEIYPPCSFVFAPDAAKFLSYCHQMSQSVNLQFYWGKEQFQPVKVVTIRFFFNHPLVIYYFMIVAFLGNYRLTFGLVLLTDMTYESDFRSTRL